MKFIKVYKAMYQLNKLQDLSKKMYKLGLMTENELVEHHNNMQREKGLVSHVFSIEDIEKTTETAKNLCEQFESLIRNMKRMMK